MFNSFLYFKCYLHFVFIFQLDASADSNATELTKCYRCVILTNATYLTIVGICTVAFWLLLKLELVANSSALSSFNDIIRLPDLPLTADRLRQTLDYLLDILEKIDMDPAHLRALIKRIMIRAGSICLEYLTKFLVPEK